MWQRAICFLTMVLPRRAPHQNFVRLFARRRGTFSSTRFFFRRRENFQKIRSLAQEKKLEKFVFLGRNIILLVLVIVNLFYLILYKLFHYLYNTFATLGSLPSLNYLLFGTGPYDKILKNPFLT